MGEAAKREHNLHIFGGFTFDEIADVEPGRCIVSHNRRSQGSWTAIRNKGRGGYQWWVLTAHDATTEFTGDYHEAAGELAGGFTHSLPHLVAATDPVTFNGGSLGTASPSNDGAEAGSPSSATLTVPPRPTTRTAPAWPPRTAKTSAAGSWASTSPTAPS